MSGYAPPLNSVVRDRTIPPPDPHFEIFERLTPPDLPARQAGEDMEDYRRRVSGYTAPVSSGRRARVHGRARTGMRLLPLDVGGKRGDE